jgi:hypothetical protein
MENRNEREFARHIPTDDDIRFFREHGWWVSREPIYSNQTLDEIEQAIEQHQNGKRVRPLPFQLKSYLDWTPEKGEGLRINDYIVYQTDAIRRLTLSPVVGLIAARLANTSQIRLHNSSYVHKPSESGDAEFRVGWHTDRAYWRTCTSLDMLTAWIPLQDSNAANGTLAVLDGSHRWPKTDKVLEQQLERNFVTASHSGLDEALQTLDVPIEPRAVPVKRGHVSFHHCLLFHGSGRNRSGKPRKALILHLQDEGNQYREAFEPDGTRVTYNNDWIVRRDARGLPDYTDPDVCPVLWDDRRLADARR